MEGSLTCTENEENLQKLSKDMKHHIAQLKAELASNLESCEINPNLVLENSTCSIAANADSTSCNVKNSVLPPQENLDENNKLSKPDAIKAPLESNEQLCEQQLKGSKTINKQIHRDSKKQNFQASGQSEQLDKPSSTLSVRAVSDSQVDSSNYEKKQCLLSSQKDSFSSITNATSSPQSCFIPAEELIPVKYLQMSNASPKLLKKAPCGTGTSISPPINAQKVEEDNDYNSKSELIEEKLMKLQMQCEVLAEENIKMKKQERSKGIERIATLKKNNAELANIAKRLQEKAKSLHEQNVKKNLELASVNRELQQQKKQQQRHRARWEAERSRIVSENEGRVEAAKSQVDDLKCALRQARREKHFPSEDQSSSAQAEVLKQTHLEMLHLQKLASAASSKVVVRSLSTPVTARQKILEESNKSLRKQVTVLEENLKEAEVRLASYQEMERGIVEEKNTLDNRIMDLKNRVTLLEAELEEAKVEASDASVQLVDLKLVYSQLQSEYATVRQQLAVVTQERDLAARKCLEENAKIEDLQSVIKKLESNEASMKALHTRIEEASSEKICELVAAQKRISTEHTATVDELKLRVSKLEEENLESKKEKTRLEEELSLASAHVNNISQPERDLDVELVNNQKMGIASFDLTPLSNQSLSCDSRDEIRSHPTSASMSEAGDITADQSSRLSRGSDGRPFIAKYSYDPYQGPNEHPESELPLVAGDLLYVHGDVDDDGFYDGELLSGRRGLVPSNFVEAVDETENASTSYLSSPSPVCRREKRKPETTSVVGYDFAFGLHSYPKTLDVIQLPSNQLEIKWTPASLDPNDRFFRYDVIMNGLPVAAVQDENRVCLESPVQEDFVVSVCTVSRMGRSDPGHCIFTNFSPTSPPGIAGLECEHVTMDSARLRWSPLDSSLTYKVSIREVGEDSPGKRQRYQRQMLVTRPFYRHTIDGLKRDCEYEVVVGSKHPATEGEIHSAAIRFRTPARGPPDPPSGITVEDIGASVLLSWIPVPLNDKGLSNGVPVVGYKWFLNDQELATVDSATTCKCRVSMEIFTKLLIESAGEDIECTAFDSHYLRQMAVVGRTIAADGHLSDFSSPFNFTKDFVQSLRNPNNGRPLCMSSHNHDSSTSVDSKANSRGEETSAVLNSGSIIVNHAEPALVEKTHIEQPNDKKSTVPKTKNKQKRKRKKSDLQIHSKSWCVSSTSDAHTSSRKHKSSVSFRCSDSSSPEDSRSFESNSFQNNKIEKRRKTPSHITTNGKQQDHKLDETSSNHFHLGLSNMKSENNALKDAPVSLYVALFDYNPTVMSPNSDCYEDELPFSEGQIIKVYGEKDDDGFFVGEDQLGRRGFVPSNMVVLAEVEDNFMVEKLFSRGRLSASSSRSVTSINNDRKKEAMCNSTRGGDVDSQVAVDGLSPSVESNLHRKRLFRALYDYDPKEASPNVDSEIELSFSRGDVLCVFGPPDGDGFYRGELRGQYGLVPSNFVQPIPEEDSPSKSSDTPISSPSLDFHSGSRSSDPIVTSSTTNKANNRSDKLKKTGVLSKGKKFFKKFGYIEKLKR